MRIWLIRLVLLCTLLPCALGHSLLRDASAAMPAAPPLTPTELTQLHNVTAWDIQATYSQTRVDSASIGGLNVTYYNYNPPQVISGWSLSHSRELSYVASATADGCGPFNGSLYKCDPDLTFPAQFDETAAYQHDTDTTEFSDGCTSNGIDFGPKQVKDSDDWTRAHDFIGDEITHLYSAFYINYGTNPPQAVGGPQFSDDQDPDIRTTLSPQCIEAAPAVPVIGQSPPQSLCACIAGGGDSDTQFRLEQGRFVVHGSLDVVETTSVPGFQDTPIQSVITTHAAWVVKEHVDKPLTIDSIDTKEPAYPGETLGTVPATGVVDGNLLSVIASVHNHTTDPQTVEVDFLDDETGQPLPGGSIGGTLAAGEVQPFTYVWDTEGQAWSSGTAHVSHRIDVVVRQNATDIDSRLKSVKIIPRPVVLVHGFVSDAGTWGSYTGFLKAVNPAWRAYAVGDGQAPGVMNTGSLQHPLVATNTIDDNALILSGYLAGVRSQLHAAHADLVVHSMGGLISRDYIQAYMPLSPDDRPVVAHLIMLGTPNRGTNCAIPGLYVPILMPALQQLSNSYVDLIFNSQVTDQRGVPFSVLAGVHFPVSCLAPLTSDPVVTETSARYIYGDVEDLDIMHTSMTGSQFVFDFFVKPRLTGVSAPAAPAAAFAGAAQPPAVLTVATPPEGAPPQLIFAQPATVPATSTLDVPITVGAGSALSINVIAPPALTMTLTDPLSAPVSPTFDGGEDVPFRSYHVDGPAAGSWTLHFDNATDGPLTAAIAATLDGNAVSLTLQHGAPDGDGSVAMTGTLADDGAPVLDAAVTATLTGADGAHGPITLLDDGAHGDGSAGDGVYGGDSGPLAAGLYGILLHATAPGIDQATAGSVGSPPPPAGCALDSDCDGVADGTDDCAGSANAGQTNTDAANASANHPGADSLGDACDDDIDGDGTPNAQDGSPLLYCGVMRADVDGDGSVSILDLATVAQYFLQAVAPANERYNQDGDYAISILDLATMSGRFLQNVSACP